MALCQLGVIVGLETQGDLCAGLLHGLLDGGAGHKSNFGSRFRRMSIAGQRKSMRHNHAGLVQRAPTIQQVRPIFRLP